MATRDDKPIAGLLRRGLSRSEASAGDCPGPDLLAAYYERSLDLGEKARWEVHFASCPHCRGQLAALARSEAPRTIATRPAWFLSWHWLAPAAAALAVVLVWVVVRSSPIFVHKGPAQLEQSAAIPSDKTTELASNATPAPSQAPRKEEAHPSLGAPAARPRASASDRAAKRNAPPAGTQQQDVIEAERTKSENEAEKTPEAETKPRIPPENNPAVAGMQVAAVPAPPPAPNQAAPSASAERADKFARPSRLARAVPEAAGQGNTAALKAMESRLAPVLILTPDVAVVWRIAPEGAIERSTDAGKTWRVQVANVWRSGAQTLVQSYDGAARTAQRPLSNVNPELAAGSAPSTKICWIVGHAGTILRTIDGEHWERVAPPAAVDLVSVQARDSQSASVTTADGRTFVTEDGGQTWQLKP